MPDNANGGVLAIRSINRSRSDGCGIAAAVARGQRLRVTDRRGLQVVDMAVFNRANTREKLSTFLFAIALRSGDDREILSATGSPLTTISCPRSTR